ncbi:hypothetical protein [Prosthecodimorpha hirschii]|uniref:hypothetical protein n=1 Tax=Prosthecodimorpha hirschii TaxID=665126 RepID=UPI001129CDEC|nr:hypothetical protein [Prosthecomicrobium hirschii]
MPLLRFMAFILVFATTNFAHGLDKADERQLLAHWQEERSSSLEQEAALLRHAGGLAGVVDRDGDVLSIRARNGKAAVFRDRPDCDGPEAAACIRHRVVAALPSAGSVLICHYHYEGRSHVLINMETGSTHDFGEVPFLSPDNRYAIEINNNLMTDPYVRVFRFERDAYVLEFDGTPSFSKSNDNIPEYDFHGWIKNNIVALSINITWVDPSRQKKIQFSLRRNNGIWSVAQ